MSEERRLEMTIISGLSGAGKSEAVATFEDMGYFCIDNLPPQMLPRVVELFALEGKPGGPGGAGVRRAWRKVLRAGGGGVGFSP